MYAEHLNPLDLNWRHFTLAVEPGGQTAGFAQIKTHGDGSRELASLIVLPAWRGQGVARLLIEHLIRREPPPLYLTCESRLVPLYRKFGFEEISPAEMPPYFRRLARMVGWAMRLSRSDQRLAVMVRNSPPSIGQI